MISRRTLSMIVVLSMILGYNHSFAQTAEELLPKAIQLEEVKGELYEAIKLYQMILDHNPDNRMACAEALLHLGMCYEKLGLDLARQTYRQVISKYPDQEDKAAIARDRISRLNSYTAELLAKAEEYLKKGNELFKRWEYEEAIKEYENAVSSGPNTELALNARYCIGQSWYRAGQYDKALATFTKLIEENPKSYIAPVTELMMAQVQNAMGSNKNQERINNSTDENVIIDPNNGIKYTRIKTFTGKNDLISYTSGGFNFTPDGRFMVLENKVVPVDGSDAFNLVEMEALRAVYAPDMKKVAFYADSSIWTVTVSPETGRTIGQPEKLITGRYRFQSPVSWSPDGDKLAFERVDKVIAGDIWTIDVSNYKLIPVTKSLEFESAPVWSPDGKSIVYRKEGNLWITSINGKETKMIIKNGGYPHWSPDSKWLFHSNWENNHLYSLDQDKNYKLTPPKQVGNFVSFSSNGEKMFYYHPSFDDKWGIKVVSTYGGPSFTPELIGTAYDSHWSNNSKQILVQSENEKGEVSFKIMPVTGENPVRVNIEVQVNGKPFPFTASPDLTKLAFSVTRADRKKDLYIVPFSMSEARTTGPARLFFEGWSGGAYNVLISWSPNGSKLAVVNEGDIWVYSLKDGTLLKITDTPEKELWVSWSPDEKMIGYLIQSNQTRTAYVIPGTGGISKIISPDLTTGNWSPDSKSMAILSNNELKISSLDGKILNQIVNIRDLGFDDISSPQYSTDGKYLAFIGYYNDNGNRKSLIITYSIESGRITRLADDNLDDSKYSLRWSPDGKWLSYLTEEMVKVRPEGTMWEADFEEVVEKLGR
jgi:Tol biopolymer transport system component/TolA-binding protein